MGPSYVAFLVTILYPLIAAIIAVIIPHLIHMTHLLSNPWMQESWQVEAMCAAVIVEHWFINEAETKVEAQALVKPHTKVARTRVARPLPAFVVRRHVVTKEEVLSSMNTAMSAAHPQVIAAYERELQVEAEVAQLRVALENAIKCARMGYSSTQMKKLIPLVWRLPNIPIECAEEILAARPHWRNPRGVQARLETALAYL